jgi:hypothetical protein
VFFLGPLTKTADHLFALILFATFFLALLWFILFLLVNFKFLGILFLNDGPVNWFFWNFVDFRLGLFGLHYWKISIVK